MHSWFCFFSFLPALAVCKLLLFGKGSYSHSIEVFKTLEVYNLYTHHYIKTPIVEIVGSPAQHVLCHYFYTLDIMLNFKLLKENGLLVI